jgi:KDO2-lipid IV(A) lauroyltransferase
VAVQSRNAVQDAGLSGRVKVRLGLVAARVFSLIAYYTPVRVGYLLSDIVAVWMFLRFHGYRRAVMANLRTVYRGSLPERELRKRARWVFRTSSRNFWDVACLPHFEYERLGAMHDVEEGDWKLIDEAMARGKGGIMISAHLGAFDFIGQYVLAGRHLPLVLTTSTVPPYLFAGVTYWRRSLGSRIEIVNSNAVRRVVHAIRNGELVTLVPDRNFGGAGYPVDFFGKPTTLPSGPVKLARETGAPLLPVIAYRKSIQHRRREFFFRLGQPIYIERTANRDDDIERGMRQLVAVLEQSISRAPEQWVMFQPVWPEQVVVSSS